MYAYFKQATEGIFSLRSQRNYKFQYIFLTILLNIGAPKKSRPAFIYIVERAKWDAW